MIRLYVDGGTRGNVICVVDPQKLYTVVKRRKGVQTNNDLEYLAMIYGIEYANSNYPDDNISINSDSLLVVNHIKDRWKCKSSSLSKLLSIVKRKMNGNVTVRWVPREKNLAGIHLEKFY